MTPLRCLRFFAVRGMLCAAVMNNPATAATIRILNLFPGALGEARLSIYPSIYPYALDSNGLQLPCLSNRDHERILNGRNALQRARAKKEAIAEAIAFAFNGIV
jgi:hypothetical protein